jgi:hypothetical protein
LASMPQHLITILQVEIPLADGWEKIEQGSNPASPFSTVRLRPWMLVSDLALSRDRLTNFKFVKFLRVRHSELFFVNLIKNCDIVWNVAYMKCCKIVF